MTLATETIVPASSSSRELSCHLEADEDRPTAAHGASSCQSLARVGVSLAGFMAVGVSVWMVLHLASHGLSSAGSTRHSHHVTAVATFSRGGLNEIRRVNGEQKSTFLQADHPLSPSQSPNAVSSTKIATKLVDSRRQMLIATLAGLTAGNLVAPASAALFDFKPSAEVPVKGRAGLPGSVDLTAEALSQPDLEIRLSDEASLQQKSTREQAVILDASIAKIVAALEANGGTQLASASSPGRWALPWVGGWQRVWSPSFNENDSFIGGPNKQSVAKDGSVLEQVSCRQFLYGPGEGGIVVEYLHAIDKNQAAPTKILLTRAGAVANLGGNFFELEFPSALLEYKTRYEAVGKVDTPQDTLVSDTPLNSGVASLPTPDIQQLETTYLSEKMWIVRGFPDRSKVSVFERTETRSVLDRRGLVAEGQVKPPEDDQVRFGKLLFGETLSDYGGWDEKALKAKAEQDKLFNGR